MRPVVDLACQQLVELVTEYLDEALSEPLRRSFEAHLEVCDDCAVYVGQMRLSIRALRPRASASSDARRHEQSLERFREWKRRSAGS